MGERRTRAADEPVQRRPLDRLSKEVVEAGLPQLLALVGVEVDVASLQPRPVELPGTAHYADLVHEDGTGKVVHVEIQQRPDPDMPRRMVEYAARILARHPSAVRPDGFAQVLIQVSGPAMPSRLHAGGLRNEVRLLHVPSTAPAVLLAASALAPFAVVQGDAAVVAEAASVIASHPEQSTQATLASLALHLSAEPRTLWEHLRRTLMSDTIEDLCTRWRGVGLVDDLIEEGREEGREKGREEGREDAVLVVLEARFPGAPRGRLTRTARRLSGNGRRAPADALRVPALDD